MTTIIEQVSYHTVGTNTDKPRLWIEEAKMDAAGFARDARYRLEHMQDTLRLVLDPRGDWKVSGNRHGRTIPILDLRLPDDADAFGAGARVRALFTDGEIRISVHQEDAARTARERRFRERLAAGELTEASMFTGGGVSTHAIHRAIEVSDRAPGSPGSSMPTCGICRSDTPETTPSPTRPWPSWAAPRKSRTHSSPPSTSSASRCPARAFRQPVGPSTRGARKPTRAGPRSSG